MNIHIREHNRRIWTIEDRKEEKFLQTKTKLIPVAEVEKKDIDSLVKLMRKLMTAAHGIGLSANQIGVPYRLFVAQLPTKDGKGYTGKFYAILNPKIVSQSKKTIADQEGCLSIPHTYGTVDRAQEVVVEGFDKQGRPTTVKAQQLLARIFQHEIDHLDGILFTSKARDVFTVNGNDARVVKN